MEPPMIREADSNATMAPPTPRFDERSDIFFLVSVISPLLFCCFAIFLCALNSIWKTRKKLEELNRSGKREPSEFTEYTIDLTTKVDSYVELSSAQISSKEMSELIVKFNVGGKHYAILKTSFPTDSVFFKWFVSRSRANPFVLDSDGYYFVDRDPESFGVILNYFRLLKSNQLWEACLPKDPDRLALLTQEADHFHCTQLRDQAIFLLQSCRERHDDGNYVSTMLAKSESLPQGFDKLND